MKGSHEGLMADRLLRTMSATTNYKYLATKQLVEYLNCV